jgi:hypothetical protein
MVPNPGSSVSEELEIRVAVAPPTIKSNSPDMANGFITTELPAKASPNGANRHWGAKPITRGAGAF